MADVWASPKRFEQAFSEEDRKRVYDFLCEPGWQNGWKTVKQDTYTMLHKHFAGWVDSAEDGKHIYECQDELQKNSPLLFDAWLGVRDKIFAGHKLVRCYANGMCYGMDGTVHWDANEPGNYTAVYYPHEQWSPDWGGETIFYNQQRNRIMACVYPRPNSMVVFDGRIPHRANGVSRSYAGMRITLMFKTEKPNGTTGI